MDPRESRIVGGRGGSLAGRWFPESRAGRLVVAAMFGGLLWMHPEVWVVLAAMLLGGVMCVFRVRGQPLAEAAAAGVGGIVLFQVTELVVCMLAVLLAASLSSIWEAPVARLLTKRGWLGAVRMRELRVAPATGTDSAGAAAEADPPLRLREVPGRYRWLLLGSTAGMLLSAALFLPMLFWAWSWMERSEPPPEPPRAEGLRPAPIPSLESVADLDWELLARDRQEVSVSDLRGKVLFVNRWATWCAPCIVEMPGIQELTRTFPGEEVAWLPVSDEPLPVVLEFAREQQWDLPLYAALSDTPAPFDGSAIPATFIVDREGRIVFQHVGAAEWNTPAVVRFLTNLVED